MYLAHSKAILILGATILLLTACGVLYTQPPTNLYYQNLPFSTSSSSRTTPVIFRMRPEFFDMTETGDANWTAVVPPNGGFTSKPAREGTGGYEMVGITMFHQLHCLQMIRTAMQDLVAAKGVGSRMMGNGRRELGDEFGVRRRRKRHGPHLDQVHYVHCFDYLMQGILCSADDTIEYGHADEQGRKAVDGYEVEHQCRSADALWAEVMGTESIPGWRTASTELKQ